MFQLPQLKYKYNALEPYIDEETMRVHHTKHHQVYTDKFNTALKKYPELYEKSVQDLLSDLDSIPEDIGGAVRNTGGGYYNHNLFWEMMSPNGGGEPQGTIATAINESFGSFESFKEQFTQSAVSLFGSGWTWLVKDSGGYLLIVNTLNQNSPISKGYTPLLGIDVWEHAYYLKYQNRRPDFIKAWWNVVNWEKVNEYFNS